jgi:hypothetical protein
VLIAKSLGLVPVMLGTMLFSGALPVLDNVANSAVEVVPVSVFGKVSGELSEATGVVAAPMEIELLVTAANPLATADNVYVPCVVKMRLLNVTTPLTAFSVSVPLTPDGLELIVTCAEEPVNGFPLVSCNWTTTGLSAVPAVPVAGGSVVNANCGT